MGIGKKIKEIEGDNSTIYLKVKAYLIKVNKRKGMEQ
jgi:hypothetical protein